MGDPWSLRQLCDDGACTGVIGADGRCGVCGRAARHWGDERRRGLLDEDEADRQTEEHVVRRAAPAAPDDFERRALCPDGGCVGLLDARGVCRVCGASDSGAGSGGDPDPDTDSDSDPASGSDPDSESDPDSDSGSEGGDEGDGDGPDQDEDEDDDGEDGEEHADDSDDDSDDSDDSDDAVGDDEIAAAAADPGRELCPDGGCVGLIGDDGRCKVCGRAGERRP